jgi:hypothetical protein
MIVAPPEPGADIRPNLPKNLDFRFSMSFLIAFLIPFSTSAIARRTTKHGVHDHASDE